MDFPDVDSILFRAAHETWSGESAPAQEYIQLMDALPALYAKKSFKKMRKTISQISRLDLQPSQAMRVLYWEGRYLAEADSDNKRAFNRFDQALSIASEGDDIDSMICLAFTAADALFDDVLNRDALVYFELARDYWHVKKPDPATRHPVTEMILQTAIVRQKWSIGDIEESHQMLAHVLGIARHSRIVSNKRQFARQYANALWMLALVFRTQSDNADGDVGYLHDALSRQRAAAKLYWQIDLQPNMLGRFAVQIAELYLDLVELHLQRIATDGPHAQSAARAMRGQALNYVNQAREHLADTQDAPGKMLERITRLRWRMSWPSAYATSTEFRAIETEFAAIETDPVTRQDILLQAKAATLRAEWLMAIGDTTPARNALLLALEGFMAGGAGMATRAERLLRRLDTSTDPYGVANLVTNSRN